MSEKARERERKKGEREREGGADCERKRRLGNARKSER